MTDPATFWGVTGDQWQAIAAVGTGLGSLATAAALILTASASKRQANATDIDHALRLKREYEEYAQRIRHAATEDAKRVELRHFLNHLEVFCALQMARKFEIVTNNLLIEYLVESVALIRSVDVTNQLLDEVSSSSSYSNIRAFENAWPYTIANKPL